VVGFCHTPYPRTHRSVKHAVSYETHGGTTSTLGFAQYPPYNLAKERARQLTCIAYFARCWDGGLREGEGLSGDVAPCLHSRFLSSLLCFTSPSSTLAAALRTDQLTGAMVMRGKIKGAGAGLHHSFALVCTGLTLVGACSRLWEGGLTAGWSLCTTFLSPLRALSPSPLPSYLFALLSPPLFSYRTRTREPTHKFRGAQRTLRYHQYPRVHTLSTLPETSRKQYAFRGLIR
jgi:hypothetical protein